MANRSERQLRLDQLRRDFRTKVRSLNHEVSLHIDGGLDPLPIVNDALTDERALRKILKKRISKTDNNFVKKLTRQELRVNDEHINEITRLKKRIYNHRYRVRTRLIESQ